MSWPSGAGAINRAGSALNVIARAVHILRRQQMTALAMAAFASALGLHVGTVVSLCSEEEMCRVHARRIIAVMQDVEAISNGAAHQFPGQTVSIDEPFATATTPKNSVAFDCGTAPRPAAGTDRHARPEAFSQCFTHAHNLANVNANV